MMKRVAAIAAGMIALAGCSEPADARPPVSAQTPQAVQRGDGAPYEILGTEVWDVPDPVSGRRYQVFVHLPPSYAEAPGRRYPVLYATDADYAFPILRQIGRRVNLNGPVIEEFILVGLSYSEGDSGTASRNRDYTPTPNGPRSASSTVHGGGSAYQTYLKSQVLPFIEERFRADPDRRVLLGHSYGALLGAQILFTEPELFSGYILGSPSFWFDRRHIMRMEAAYARDHRDLPANVFMYIGSWEVPGSDRRNTDDADMVGDVRAMETTLRSRNYPGLTVQSTVLADEDHLTVAPVGFTRGLVAVLPAQR